MKFFRVNDYDMAYIDIGKGQPTVCIHGALNDFRAWTGILSGMSDGRRLITPSLRHYFPERWDGKGGQFNLAQHIDDVIAFIEGLDDGPVDLIGHSRGGLLAFRLALRRPDLLRGLVLAEPAGALDPPLMRSEEVGELPAVRTIVKRAAEKIVAGDVADGLRAFVDGIGGAGAWDKLPAVEQQMREDNAYTLVVQSADPLEPYSKEEAQSLSVETLFVLGAETRGMLPVISKVLADLVPNAGLAVIPNAGHSMLRQQPKLFCETVLAFLSEL